MPSLKTILLTCILIAAVFTVYLPGLHGPFIFDDLSNITNNAHLRLTQLNTNNVVSALESGHAGPLKRPIAMLSFALNYYFAGGYIAPAFKITNIAVHCLNAILVTILCLQLLKRASLTPCKPKHYNYKLWLAFSISILWAVHPINLTSILYIVQRMTSLSTLFSLSCIILYLSARNHALKHSFSWRTTGLLLSCLISLILALFSKENAVLIPFIILLIELTLFPTEKPWVLFKALPNKNRVIIWACVIIACSLALLWTIDYASSGFNSRPFTMLERVLTESRVLCFYISLILIPRINGFGLFHDDVAISTSLFSPWTTIVSVAFILGLLATAFYYRKKNPLFALGIGWFFIGHLLESTFFSLEIAHEHRNNLPSIGIILAAFSLIPFAKFNNKKATASIFFIAIILGSTTWLRAEQWGNYQTLAYYEAEHHPDSPAIQALLSNAANQAGDIEIATQAIKKAMALDPKETAYAMHYQNILAIHNKVIPYELQQETLRRIKANHLTPSTQLALDQIVGCLKKEPCAPLKQNYLEWISTVIEKSPNTARYWYMRGKTHRAMNDDLAALNDYQKAYVINDGFLHPLFEMADILLRMGQIPQTEEIIKWIEEANEKTAFKRDREIEQLKRLVETIKSNNSN
jgi:tetratricopeptide (TPR) repeat protein